MFDKEESWLIAYQQFFGDPGQEEVWAELDSFLLSTWETAGGQKVKITCTMIDSGGAHADSVYRFVRARQGRRIFALKGSSESRKEILGKFSINNQYRVKLWLIGTDTAKDRIFARMKIPGPGPGYMHLPDFAEDEYLAHLNSVYNDVGSVKTHFSGHLPGSVFSLTRNLFPATRVRAVNRSMEPSQFHQPSIRSQPVSGP